ncbi:MAG TPA: L-seryl-tRNA(Sec) selenium transferase [Terriglobia bacterium]|jgi:L-seryl-tRNA(Ser) seleniumtransferase
MRTLRQIPPVNDVLRELHEFRNVLGQPFAAAIIDEVFAETRRRIAEGDDAASRVELTSRIAAEVAKRLRNVLSPSLRRVINGSGVVLHTNLGRAVLPEGAIDHLREISTRYSNLELDVEAGKRGKRDVHVNNTLRQLLGCEAAIVVNNNAAAVLLVLTALGRGGEVLASRGEQVEIGESFRIPDIMAQSGAHLREVGSTNRTRIGDFEKAISEHTRLLLRVHPSNFRMVGFTERPSLEDFVDLGWRRKIPTFEDLGSGCVLDMKDKAVSDEPVACASIRAGVDIISFSGDKLLGGPQAGIIAGKELYIERIRRNPLFRALRVDKLTIAVLEYVLGAYLRGELDTIPTWRMLRAQESELKARAESFAAHLGNGARAVQVKSVVGGGSAPETYLPSWGIALAAALEAPLRMANPPVISRIEEGQVILDFRTIFPEEESELLAVVKNLAGEGK